MHDFFLEVGIVAAIAAEFGCFVVKTVSVDLTFDDDHLAIMMDDFAGDGHFSCQIECQGYFPILGHLKYDLLNQVIH